MLSAFVRTADHDGAHGLWIGEKDLDVLNDGIHTLPNGMPNATGKCFLRCFLREYKRVLQISGKLFIFRYERLIYRNWDSASAVFYGADKRWGVPVF